MSVAYQNLSGSSTVLTPLLNVPGILFQLLIWTASWILKQLLCKLVMLSITRRYEILLDVEILYDARAFIDPLAECVFCTDMAAHPSLFFLFMI